MNTLTRLKQENKQAVREHEARKQQAEAANAPITYAKAWVNYIVLSAGEKTPWHLHIEFYPGGELNRYSPVEQVNETHEWLDQCFTTIGNAIRIRGLHDCHIDVASAGQPPVERDEVWPSNW